MYLVLYVSCKLDRIPYVDTARKLAICVLRGMRRSRALYHTYTNFPRDRFMTSFFPICRLLFAHMSVTPPAFPVSIVGTACHYCLLLFARNLRKVSPSKDWWALRDYPPPSPALSWLCPLLWQAWVVCLVAGSALLMGHDVLTYVG